MSLTKQTSRRGFIKTGVDLMVAAAVAPSVVPSSVLGRQSTSPGNKIVMACIGVGWMGGDNMKHFLGFEDVKIVAVCDVDKNHLEDAKNKVNKTYGNNDCATYGDFRQVLERDDIDAVSLGLPDHWHAIPAIMAAKKGKDIYGEKPLSHTLREGRAMCEAVKRYQRIWQTGSWQRSQANFRFASELVRNGRIGKIHTIEVGLPAGHSDFAGTKGQEQFQDPPPELDYNFWLGPAPYGPYAVARVHKNWRWVLDHGGGQLMDWIGHHLDIGHWGADLEHTGPVEIEGHGDFPRDGLWNSPTKYRVDAIYPNGIHVILAGGHPEICNGHGGTKWIGDSGWVWVDRGSIDANPKRLLKEKIGPEEIHLYNSKNHWRNFIEGVKTRKVTIAPCEIAHRSASPGHLGQLSMLLGRKIRFNPETEEIINDATATEMLGYPMRAPWRIEY